MSEQQPETPTPESSPDWRTMHLWQFQPVRDVLIVLSLLWLVQLGYTLSLVTVPMLLALLLAYLVEPLVKWVTGQVRWVSRPIAAGSLIVLIGLTVIIPVGVGVVFGVGQALGSFDRLSSNVSHLRASIDAPQDEVLLDRVPEGWRPLRDYLVGLDDRMEGGASEQPAEGEPVEGEPGEQVSPAAAEELTTTQRLGRRAVIGLGAWLDSNIDELGKEIGGSALEVGAWFARSLIDFASWAFRVAFSLFLTMFFFFFFSSSLGSVKKFFERLVPRQHRRTVFDLVGKMDGVIAGFVRGRLMIMAIMSVMFIVGYWLIGVPAPLLVGIGVGVLSAVPYLSLIGLPITITLLVIEPSSVSWQDTWWWTIGAPFAVYQIVQISDDYIWTPLIQGKATDMDTPTILFAVLAGGVLMGIYGVLVAIPVAACLKILVRDVLWPRVTAWIDGREKDPLPLDRT